MPRRLGARALAALLALPGAVAFAVPLLLAWTPGEGWPVFRLRGLLLLVPGLVLLLWCVRLFAVQGRGTLAPWDPPRALVASGPYRVSRNPMYVAVLLVLAGWAAAFASPLLLLYAAAVAVSFHLRVVFHEEPRLREAFRRDWPGYARRTPRWIFPSRRALVLTAVALVTAAPIAGLVYEAYADAEAARSYPAPGDRVDVGGRRLHLLCLGDGQPTVIFEASGWSNALSFEEVRNRLARQMRVCSYDRAGKGWSDPGPAVMTTADLARDLAVLQDRARIPGPLVLVASSIGGLTAEMFARQYPERVAGLVFVDAASSEILAESRHLLNRATVAACAAALAARAGLVRLLDPFGLEAEGTDQGRRSAAVTYGARPWAALCAQARGLRADPAPFDGIAPLRADLPLVVLSASSDDDLFPASSLRVFDALRAARRSSHQALAARSRKGVWRLVPESTHLIAASRPEAVAEAVLEVVDRAATAR